MTNERVFAVSFAGVCPHYVAKASRHGRSVDELHDVIEWLAGFVRTGSDSDWAFAVEAAKNPVAIALGSDLAPRLNPNVALITGVVCGIRV